MRRPDKAGGKVAKTQRLKTLKRRNTVARRRKPSAVDATERVALLTRERDEALEQQRATSEVLRVISSSPGELEPVFQAMLANAMRICEAEFGIMYEFANGKFRATSWAGVPPAYADYVKHSRVWGPGTGLGQLVRTKQTVHIGDVAEGSAYAEGDPGRVATIDLGRVRTALIVPMLRENELVGAFVIYRTEVRPFTDKQIELVKNFAAQAVIAIENTRLLSELRESLQQQTATSEVLSAISSSPGELEPVFRVLLENATRICEAKFGNLVLYENKVFRMAAMYGAPPQFAEKRGREPVVMPGPKSPLFRIVTTRRLQHIVDLQTDEAYVEDPPTRAFVELAGARSIVVLPMLKDNELIGAIGIYRQEVRPFTDTQLGLLTSFAKQAVIAIENTRLLNELRESLQQQTATADVLKVISGSAFDLKVVLEALIKSATQLCGATRGHILQFNGEFLTLAAAHGAWPGFAEYLELHPFRPGPGTIAGKAAAEHRTVHVHDVLQEPGYELRDLVKQQSYRTVLAVPMLRKEVLLGVITIPKTNVEPFTDKQIELVETFADQAVIAIENARLLTELRESLQQQTATADVLKVISSSPGTLEPVFSTMLAKATELCEASYGTLWLREGDGYRAVTMHGGLPPVWIEQWRSGAIYRPGPDRPMARAAEAREPIQVADMRTEPSYLQGDALPVAGVEIAGIRTLLLVPMFKESEHVGLISIYRKEVLPFTEKQIDLVKNFAAQAVIAIENTRLLNELRESLQQRTATADVLKVISSSPGELEPVFSAILENATHICGAKFGTLFLSEGDGARAVAHFRAPPAFVEAMQRRPVLTLGEGALGRAARTKQAVQIADVRIDPAYVNDPPRLAVLELAGMRTILNVPMLKDNELVGQIAIFRQEVLPFTDKQIEVVKNFAAQAVIAIENTRLLNELRESLQQQTATADVLKVISSSPGQLAPVFDSMLENATRICGAGFGTMYHFDGKLFDFSASYGTPSALVELQKQRGPFLPEPGGVLDRLLLTKQVAHSADFAAELPQTPVVALGGARSTVAVPMLKDNELVGGIVIYRKEVRPFSDKEVDLVKNFAAQAVIAIENTRLLSELRESLQQQTATADVLKVISTSPGELEPVFRAMLENATRICDASYSAMWLREGDAFRNAAFHGALPAAYTEQWRGGMIVRLDLNTPLARVAQSRKPLQVADLRDDQAYRDGQPLTVTAADVAGIRTLLGVPMLKDDELMGVISIYRKEVRPFTDKQVELVENFAAQAIIAIENARLLNELRTRTNELAQSVGELQALGEVSQAVNSTLDLETVLTTIVGRAVELSHTDTGAIYVFDEVRKEFRLHATYGMSEAMIAAITDQHIGLGDSNIGAATTQRKPVQVPDIRNQPSPVNEIILREGYRGILIIPLLRPDHIIGALVVRRKTPGEFPQSTIDLLQTFADQSVVAVQNARLYENVEARTRELVESLEDLRTTQDRLVQTQKLASLGQLTAGIAHEIKNPLNFVNNFSGVSAELIDELRDTLKGPLDDKARAEINELTDTLRSNLDKVVQHGKRADAIVKNMLLHSREGSGEHRPVDINALVEESLNLAYHGARAEKQGFTITLERSLDPAAGAADVFPQDITRALLNLISNGFYAATKRKTEANGGDYEPTLTAATKNLGDRVEITIRDNGTGIPPDVKEKMFNPFFTTKPAGEGTGLGLSISHDIIVKQHGGSIEVETQPGEFTELRIILPRAAALLLERS